MPSGRKRNVFSHGHFNLAQLLRLAEEIRHQPCTCDEAQSPKFGALNWAIFIKFDDGVEWVFRSPMISAEAGDPGVGRPLASEAATLKYIRKHSSIPVPEVFRYSARSQNDIGVPYMLMSKADGRRLASHYWQAPRCGHPKPVGSMSPQRVMSPAEKEKVMRQLGSHACGLFQLRFPKIGSLAEHEGEEYSIEECLSPGHILQGREEVEDIARGPFHEAHGYYSSLVSALLLHAEQLPMGYHVLLAPVPTPDDYLDFTKFCIAQELWNDYAAVEGKAEWSNNRLQYSLAGHYIRDQIIPQLSDAQVPQTSGFPLCHHDISMQNVFVDDDFNITCIIDWASSSTVPPAQLLATPGLPHPRDLVLDTALIQAFRSGFDEESIKLGVLPPAANHWKTGDMIARFMRVVNLDALQDYHHLEALQRMALGHSPAPCDHVRAKLADMATTPEASALAAALAADDDPQSKAKRRETRYFATVGQKRLALAQKVTLASKQNALFVADGRLWRWIEASLERKQGDRPEP